MAFVPLIPLTPNLVNAPSQPGFVAPKGISALPSDWKPAPQQIRLASFPTPLAVLDATRLALEEPADTPHQSEFAQAAELLLAGIVQGIYTVRWVPIAELSAPALRTSLTVAWREHGHKSRIGLIERSGFDPAGQRLPPELVGVVVDDLVPAVAARFVEGQTVNLTPLRQHLSLGGGQRPDVVAALLRVVRDPLQRAGQWLPNQFRWMALFDRLIGLAKASINIDIGEDIRSVGPFYVPVSASTKGDAVEDQRLYLPCHAPGFARRLANALLLGQRTPADAGGRAGHVEFIRAGQAQAAAAFEICSARPLPAIELGEGCATWLDTTGAYPTAPQARQLLDADALKPGSDFERHVRLVQTQLAGVDDVVLNAPTRLTDIARVVALYVPELVGWSRAVDLSPRYERWATEQRQGARPSKAYLTDAVGRARAYVLDPAASGSNAAAAVFLEDAPVHGGENRNEIADLSTIGLALWMAFNAAPKEQSSTDLDTWGARWSALGVVNGNGKVLLATNEEFVLTIPEYLDGFFRDASAVASVRKRTATLQRFLRAYPPGKPALEGLLGLGARRFVQRVLGTEADVESILAPGVGVPPGPAFTLTTSDYGSAAVFPDAFRSI